MVDQVTAPEPTFRETVEQAEQQPQQPQQYDGGEHDEQQQEGQQREDGQEPAERVDRVVPLAALHEERRRRQDLQRTADESARNFMALQQQQAAMMQYLQQQQRASQPPPPSENSDPVGFMVDGVKRTQAELQQMRSEMRAQQQHAQQQQFTRQFVDAVSAAEAAHARAVPDSRDAVQYLRQRKFREYVAAGMDDQSASAAVDRDGWALSQQCLQQGVNPAERAYEIAKALGYRRRATAEETVRMQQAGQRASTPGGNAGQGGGRTSLDALSKMSPKDFLEATKGDKWRKLMGG